MKKKHLYLILLFAIAHFINAQSKKTDSLRNSLKNAENEVVKINALMDLANELKSNLDTFKLLNVQAHNLAAKINYPIGIALTKHSLAIYKYYTHDLDSAQLLYEEALKIWSKIETNANKEQLIKIKKGKAKTLANLAGIYAVKFDYAKAIPYYEESALCFQQVKDKAGLAKTYCGIGILYQNQDNYPKAIEYYLKAKKLFEETGDKKSIGVPLGNMGNVYMAQLDYDKALDCHFKSLSIARELNDKDWLEKTLGNIGAVYFNQKSYDKALDYFSKSEILAKELGDKQIQSHALGNMGSVYLSQNDYTKAKDYVKRSLKIAEELDDKKWIAINLANLGKLYTNSGEFKLAEDALKRGISICEQIKALSLTQDIELLISHLYKKRNMPRQALEHYKKHIAARDSINNEENQKAQIRAEMNYEFDKKEALLKEQQIKERLITAESRRRQQVVIWSVALGLILVISFSVFVFRALNITKKQKHLIEKQKNLVDERQKEILDSIHYAQRIQKALLPNEFYIDKKLKDLGS